MAGVVLAPGPAAVGTDRGPDPESLPLPVQGPSKELPGAAPNPPPPLGLIREAEATVRPPRPDVPPTPRPTRRSPQIRARACTPAVDTPRPDEKGTRRTTPASNRPEPQRLLPTHSA